MVFIKERRTVTTLLVTGAQCNRCGEEVQGPSAVLTLDHSGEYEISHFCERCYDEVITGNKIEPSGHDEGQLMLRG